MADSVHQLKVTRRGVKPPVWRRVDDLRSTAVIQLGVPGDTKRVQGSEASIRSSEEPAVAA